MVAAGYMMSLPVGKTPGLRRHCAAGESQPRRQCPQELVQIPSLSRCFRYGTRRRTHLGCKNTRLAQDFQQIFNLYARFRDKKRATRGEKKTPPEQCGLSRRRVKRPYNHPLSTDNCNCQASEEERLNNRKTYGTPFRSLWERTIAILAYVNLTNPAEIRGWPKKTNTSHFPSPERIRIMIMPAARPVIIPPRTAHAPPTPILHRIVVPPAHKRRGGACCKLFYLPLDNRFRKYACTDR